MKKFTLILLLVALCTVSSMSNAQAARVPIMYVSGPEFEEIGPLPDSILSDDDNKMFFGLEFEQFSIFYVPLWNTGEVKYALYDEVAQTIYSYEHADVKVIAEEFGFTIEETPTLSFWNRIGGKLVALIIILGVLYATFVFKPKTETPTDL